MILGLQSMTAAKFVGGHGLVRGRGVGEKEKEIMGNGRRKKKERHTSHYLWRRGGTVSNFPAVGSFEHIVGSCVAADTVEIREKRTINHIFG